VGGDASRLACASAGCFGLSGATEGKQRMSDYEARLTIDQLAERFRTASEALADLQTADPADVELARQQFLEDADRRLTASGASSDQREDELRDLKARAARIRRSLGED